MGNNFGFFSSLGGGDPTYVFTVVTAGADTFQLPLEITGTYDFHVDWGDSSSSDITVYNHADTNHSYAGAGTYEVRITGTITGWTFNNGGDCALYYETKSWGPLRLGNSGNYFYGCVNHTCTATDVLDLAGTTVLSSTFRNNTSLTEIPSINSWATGSVTTFNKFVLNGTAFDQDLSGLDITSSVNFGEAFVGVTLSVANYDALILSWSAQAATGAYAFHGGNSKYTTGGAVMTARAAWVTKGWTITDGGENLSAEKITVAADRDFSGGQGNWTIEEGNDITFDNIDCDWDCDEANTLQLAVTLTEGVLYKMQFDISAYTSGNLTPYLGNTPSSVSESTTTFNLYIIAGALNFIKFKSVDFIGSIDNVSIKECIGS